MKPKIKMRLVDWWDADTETNFYNNYFIRILTKKYDIIYADKPDFILYVRQGHQYKTFGAKHLYYDCVRICYSIENIRSDFNIADYAIDFDYMDFRDRHLRVPYFLLHRRDLSRQILEKKEKFCGFVVTNSNAYTTMRDVFFEKLNAYKKVDSGGKYKNNIGENVKDKIAWLRKYKFNICFENSSYPGYLTEKLFDAFAAGCIPIYWGDTSLRCGIGLESNQDCMQSESNSKQDSKQDYRIDTMIPNISPKLLDYRINPKAFINAHNFETLDDLVDEVKRIDNDSKAYQEMLNESVFLDNFQLYEYYENKILAFFDSIFAQNPQNALRRGVGQHVCGYEAMVKKFYQYRDICYYPRNLIRSMRHKIRK